MRFHKVSNIFNLRVRNMSHDELVAHHNMGLQLSVVEDHENARPSQKDSTCEMMYEDVNGTLDVSSVPVMDTSQSADSGLNSSSGNLLTIIRFLVSYIFLTSTLTLYFIL